MNYHHGGSFHEESGIKNTGKIPSNKKKTRTCGTYLLFAAQLVNKLQFPYIHNEEQIWLRMQDVNKQ